MHKQNVKKVRLNILLLLCLSMSGTGGAFAQNTATQEQADYAQFQNWLKNNGSAVSSPPSRASSRIPPPPFLASSQSSGAVSPFNAESPRVKTPHPLTYEQSQQAMTQALPPTSITPTPDDDEAFNAMMKQNMPLTPQQVLKLRQLIDQSQRAASIPATVPPKPVSSTLMVNLAPGTTPPAIRMAQGYISSLVFVDSTGAPWPISGYDIGDPKTCTIQWDGKSNVMLIQAVAPYGDSNLVIRLAGMNTPLTLELVSGQRVVDYRTDIHVAGIGPESKDLPTGSGLPNTASQLLLNVLDGVAPPGSKMLTVSGGDCTAWLLGDRMYLRTRLTILSPGWMGRMVSPDGMIAYEMSQTSSVLVSQYGNPVELKIEGF